MRHLTDDNATDQPPEYARRIRHRYQLTLIRRGYSGRPHPLVGPRTYLSAFLAKSISFDRVLESVSSNSSIPRGVNE
jgi:hypothetical protein